MTYAQILQRARQRGTPAPAALAAMAAAPDLAVAYDALWDAAFYGGSVPHITKELVRLFLAGDFDCT